MRGRRLVALLGALVLVVGACGDDDTAEDPADPTTPDPGATPAADDEEELTLVSAAEATMAGDGATYTVVVARGDLETRLAEGATTGSDVGGEVEGTVHWDTGTRIVSLPRDDGDPVELTVTREAIYVQGETSEATGEGEGGWRQLALDEVAGASTLTADRVLLVALHDPGSVLVGVQSADPSATAAQGGESGEEIDGRSTRRWSVAIPVQFVDDRFFAMSTNGGAAARPGASLGPDSDADIDPSTGTGADDTPGPPPETPDPPPRGDEADPDNGTAGVAPDGGAVTEDPATVDDGPGETLQVQVWVDEEDGTIMRMAYSLPDRIDADDGPGMPDAGSGGTPLSVMVDFDDLDAVDGEIELPAPPDAEAMSVEELAALLDRVVVIEDRDPDTDAAPAG